MKTKTLLALLIAHSSVVFSQINPVDKSGIAIGGYDVVAYFQLGKAVKGNPALKSQLNGTTYFFSTEANQKQFDTQPQKYLPQFEGYCALAVSYGKKISIDPQTFKVVNDKLYLFYNGSTGQGKVNSIETWNKNETKLLKKADELWPDVKRKKYKPEESF